MRIGKRKAIAAVFGGLAAGVALAGWYFGGTDALLAVVLAVLVIGVGLVGNVVVQTDRRLRSDINATITAALAGHTDRTRAETKEDLSRSVSGLEQKLLSELDVKLAGMDRKLQRPGEQAEALIRAINAGYTRLELEQERPLKAINRVDRTMNRLFKHAPAEIDALFQVHRRTGLDDPLPLMGGWALSPRGLLQAIELVSLPEVSLVVECGSGTSTLYLARALQLKGSGKLVAVEHLAEYLERTEQALKEHGLSEFAEVRYAPLEEIEIDGTARMWYAASAIADLDDIDVLIVDGPPGTTGERARYPAYPILRPKLAPSALIIIDDAERTDEKAIVDVWLGQGGLSRVTTMSNDQAILRVENASSS